MTQMSNVGGGSIDTSGGGIKSGFETIAQNISAKSVLKTAQLEHIIKQLTIITMIN